MAVESLDKRFADLFDRLNVLQEATTQLKELIDRLANCDFQPGSVPLGAGDQGDDYDDNDDSNVASELSSEINQILREQEEELESLQEEIIDIHTGRAGSALQHEKARLKDGAERLDAVLRDCRKSFRKAQITARHKIQEAQRSEREILYASFSNPARSGATSPNLTVDGTGTATPTTNAAATTFASRRRKNHLATSSEMSKEERMISASHDVTQSMRRTHDLMAAELAKSDFAHNTLRESTEALAQLSESYSNLDAMLSNSRALLGTLLKSQKTDTWYLRSAFYLLVVTVCWLFFRRLLWGPTWWLIWLPLKLAFRTAVGVSRTVGGGGKGAPALSQSQGQAVTNQPVAYMNNEGVPTMQVAGPESPVVSQQVAAAERAQEELVMEHIARVIEEEEEKNGPIPSDDQLHHSDLDSDPEIVVVSEEDVDVDVDVKKNIADEKGGTVLREREPWELPNPKKRMMEGPPGTRYHHQQQQQQQQQYEERVRDEL
ncbi:Sec20-domain-containing protein [Xylariaceae sp. FL0594]|nr:Sec20-domain-containing protein [Xylariaceae sp. FL0594]